MTSVLTVQIAPHRLRRVNDAADKALRQAGRPYRRWAVIVQDSENESVARVITRGALERTLARMADEKPDQAEMLRDIAAKIRSRPADVPQLVFYSVGGTDLSFVISPDA